MASPPPRPENDAFLFRASKKRKIYRQRAPENEDEPAPASPVTQSLDELISSAAHAEMVEEGASLSMAEILLLRKNKNKKRGGVKFRAESGLRPEELARVVADWEGEDDGRLPEGGLAKFAPQTGAVGDVDKHMMAFIDSELAKRRSEGLQAQTQASASPTPTPTSLGLTRGETDIQRQPATLGKLLEIDLGEEARERNVAQTERAKRILDGEEVLEETGKKVKVRLGRDGKPWRGKGRKRRGSEDVKRDQLVEAVMRENRLEIYDEPVEEAPTANDDQAADDRIAEAFRREFMDSVAARQRKKAAPAQPQARTAAGKKEEEALKGPKLGGSRTARAAMREHMLKNAKK